MTAVYNIYLWDLCCHQFVSVDTGATFVESGTPDGGDPSATTMADAWTDGQMAINDADYLTFVGVDNTFGPGPDYCGVIAISTLAGTGTTFVLVDPEKSTTGVLPSPAFMPQSDPQWDVDWQLAYSLAISSGAQIILFCTNTSSTSTTPFYPRISRDAGATWSDVTGVPASLAWSRAAFGAGGTTMYLKPDNQLHSTTRHIFKSTDSGVTWSELAAGPVYPASFAVETRQRMRCSADGQVIVTIDMNIDFWLSTDGGTSWTTTNFATLLGVAAGVCCDCSVSPDGSSIVVGFEQTLNGGFWPAVFVSTDSGATFTDVSGNIQYPVSVGPPLGGAPGTNPTGFTACNIAPDGLGVVVTFNAYFDNPTLDPDGFPEFTTYANVSTDSGATFTLQSFTADALEASTDGLGVFTSAYILPYTPITPPIVTVNSYVCVFT